MNETIRLLLNHRSIRSFSRENISEEKADLLIRAAQHAPTSSFLQQYSIIDVTDEAKKKTLAEIGNQAYIAESDRLFVIIADLRRNAEIAREKGKSTEVLGSFDYFLRAIGDAFISAQNIVVAAESMGLGSVYLGSILNDAQAVIDLLHLPKFTFPVVGIAVGYPNQSPELKPRLPENEIYHKNEYHSSVQLVRELENYDHIVSQYYDLRNKNRRIDTFTNQIAKAMDKRPKKRMSMLDVIKSQGFIQY
ncbi:MULTISPECIES: NADPH-dependent oxidoreductase [unclassified Sporolactobacillus]|uniref:NADPH-dependent oxidoreductase n=1 Tax=unclassified Sporolactobacillus TaxID=2628533 RepID=UPI0023678881|nr:NADPH-dependent oxidoreductase [Sporolactobacillus sp. CQH2019]MDD9150886.1 NADPH-dependent oxidoreductase [Sporolactobacillus sp. CQH2019]